MTVRTGCEADTRALAAAFAEIVEPGDVVVLDGPVGAGKTVFVRGLCEALEVPRSAGVSSPSYALVHLYDGGRLALAHLDLYRLEGDDELEALGFRDLLEADRVVLVEWPGQAPSVREVATFEVTLQDDGPQNRTITIRACPPETPETLNPLRGWSPPSSLEPGRPQKTAPR